MCVCVCACEWALYPGKYRGFGGGFGGEVCVLGEVEIENQEG